MTMKQIISLIASILLPLMVMAMTIDEVPNVHVADRSRYVSNPSGVLSASAVSSLDRYIGNLWKDTSVELVVVAVDEVDPKYTPEEFATKLFEKWKIGKADKDNGLLVLVSRDDRAVIIRTGYGVEGAIPDIVAGRIIRDNMLPSFRNGDYDEGVAAGVERLASIIRDPSLGDELKSSQANDSHTGDDAESESLFKGYISISAIIAAAMLLYVIYLIRSTRRLGDVERWRKLRQGWLATAIIACITIGMGILPFALLSWKMHRVRRHRHDCPHCGTRMNLIDEEHDNDYLSPSQDLEERLNSVDYDVWHCPKCSQTDILPYINDRSSYKECPVCHTRALGLVERRVLRQPTTRYEGEGVDHLVCRNCGYHDDRHFKIPKKNDDAATAAAIGGAVGAAGRRRGGDFGGGFGSGFGGGGSFGGGMTGGGGAGGRW